jgi:transglutaminase-like putative cysteine protease
MVLPAGAMQITMLECPFDSVTSGISNFDVLTSSAIKAPPNSIGIQSSVYAKYALLIPNSFTLPSTDEQKIIYSKNNTVQLSITKSYLPPDVLYPLKEIPEEIQIYLQPSRYIESENPLIQNMAKLAVRKTKRAKRAVNRIRRYVQSNIMPVLSTPYATALETAKLNKGDCTEFALLTTALCRAAHIPARVVTGIAYVPFSGNFYYHAWTQVFIEGKWYSVDAALQMFDPGHIALSFSIDGAPDSKVNDCLGILKIKQVKTSNIAPVQ